MKTQIHLPELKKAIDYIKELEKIPLKDIEWIDENGKVVEIPEKEIQDWKFTGMGNKYFAILTDSLKNHV